MSRSPNARMPERPEISVTRSFAGVGFDWHAAAKEVVARVHLRCAHFGPCHESRLLCVLFDPCRTSSEATWIPSFAFRLYLFQLTRLSYHHHHRMLARLVLLLTMCTSRNIEGYRSRLAHRTRAAYAPLRPIAIADDLNFC